MTATPGNGADGQDTDLRVEVDKTTVKDAPRVELAPARGRGPRRGSRSLSLPRMPYSEGRSDSGLPEGGSGTESGVGTTSATGAGCKGAATHPSSDRNAGIGRATSH